MKLHPNKLLLFWSDCFPAIQSLLTVSSVHVVELLLPCILGQRETLTSLGRWFPILELLTAADTLTTLPPTLSAL